MIVVLIHAMPATSCLTRYATSVASDSSWVADSDLESAVQLIDSLTFATDSLSIDNTRLRALLALEREGQPMIPASFWTRWYVWGPIALVSFGAGYYTASR
jgi:hypothetical protein